MNSVVFVVVEIEPVKFDSVEHEWGKWIVLYTASFSKATTDPYKFITDGDKCVFGIDVFVAQRNKSEVFSYDENISNPVFTWNLTNFSTLNLDSYTSDPFSSGDKNWWLSTYIDAYMYTLLYIYVLMILYDGFNQGFESVSK